MINIELKTFKKNNNILSTIKLDNITFYFIKNTNNNISKNNNKKKNNWPRYFIV